MAHTLLSTSPRGNTTAAHHVLVHGGGLSRGALGPRHPEAARREDHATQRIDAAFEVTALGEEGHHDICLAAGLTFDGHARRQPGHHAGRFTEERERRSLDDPQLLGQGRPAVPGHQPLTASKTRKARGNSYSPSPTANRATCPSSATSASCSRSGATPMNSSKEAVADRAGRRPYRDLEPRCPRHRRTPRRPKCPARTRRHRG